MNILGNEVRRLIKNIETIVRLQLTKKQLYESVEGLGVLDPESKLCDYAGFDSTGRARCENCPLSAGTLSGCGRFVIPALNSIASNNTKDAKIKLTAAAQELTALLDDIDTLSSEQHQRTS